MALMKKLGLLLILLLAITLGGCKKKTTDAAPTPTPAKKKISKPVNQISYEERPYVVMVPTLNREVDVIIKTLPKAADGVDYLSEYQHETSLGGNEQFIDLKKGLPATKQFSLYSRSAGGKTSYEEDVRGGTLTLNFTGQNEYTLKQDWAYYDRVNAKSSTKTKALRSQDGHFEISIDPSNKISYVIIYNSPGSPMPMNGKRLSEVYTVATSNAVTKKVDITIELPEQGTGKLYGWDGKAWTQLESSVSGNAVKGTQVPFLEAYVVAQ